MICSIKWQVLHNLIKPVIFIEKLYFLANIFGASMAKVGMDFEDSHGLACLKLSCLCRTSFKALNFVRSLHLNAYILLILLFDCLLSYRAFLQDVFFTTAYLQGSSGLLPWTMNESSSFCKCLRTSKFWRLCKSADLCKTYCSHS